MPLRVAIASSCPDRNRQANDIQVAFEQRGAIVRVHRPGWYTDCPPRCGTGERLLSWLPHGRGLGRVSDFARRVQLSATDVLVCVNQVALCAATPIALLRRPTVIYYCLETVTDRLNAAIETTVCRGLKAVVLVPEENRARLLESRLGTRCSVHFLPNVPHLRANIVGSGRLREYVAARLHQRDPTIVLYSGSYQPYSRLEEIVTSSVAWPYGTCLVLMVTGSYPAKLDDALRAAQNKVIIVPSVGTSELYEWIADADIGLLPYEDEDDINVRYCAPQKLFDYVACGIPFIGSRRPSIEAVSREVGCGVCIDMINADWLGAAIRALVSNRTLRSAMAARARRAYAEKYHYDRYIAPVFASLFGRALCAERSLCGDAGPPGLV